MLAVEEKGLCMPVCAKSAGRTLHSLLTTMGSAVWEDTILCGWVLVQVPAQVSVRVSGRAVCHVCNDRFCSRVPPIYAHVKTCWSSCRMCTLWQDCVPVFFHYL